MHVQPVELVFGGESGDVVGDDGVAALPRRRLGDGAEGRAGCRDQHVGIVRPGRQAPPELPQGGERLGAPRADRCRELDLRREELPDDGAGSRFAEVGDGHDADVDGAQGAAVQEDELLLDAEGDGIRRLIRDAVGGEPGMLRLPRRPVPAHPQPRFRHASSTRDRPRPHQRLDTRSGGDHGRARASGIRAAAGRTMSRALGRREGTT